VVHTSIASAPVASPWPHHGCRHRCLVFSPLPCPALTKQSMLLRGYGVKGLPGCTRCSAMSAALAPSSCMNICNQGCGRCAHQLSERAHASSQSLNVNHRPDETNNIVMVEPSQRLRRCPVRLVALSSQAVGGHGCVWAVAIVHVEVQEHSKHELHASTQANHRSPTQNSAMTCLWCVHGWHVNSWKASSVEAVGEF
jgi:hypothetical protein